MSLTVDDSTIASEPGKTRISARKYLRYTEVYGITKWIYLLILQFSNSVLYRFLGNDMRVYDWISKKEQFRLGCLNPTVILDVQKGLIATSTNLTKDFGPATDVVKISKEKLHLIRGKHLKNGDRLPSIALYYPNTENPNATAWSDFNPLVPHCFSADLDHCDRLLDRLDEASWRKLFHGLSQIKDTTVEGLYHVQNRH